MPSSSLAIASITGFTTSPSYKKTYQCLWNWGPLIPQKFSSIKKVSVPSVGSASDVHSKLMGLEYQGRIQKVMSCAVCFLSVVLASIRSLGAKFYCDFNQVSLGVMVRVRLGYRGTHGAFSKFIK